MDELWKEVDGSRKIKVKSNGKLSKDESSPTVMKILMPAAPTVPEEAAETIFDSLWGADNGVHHC